MKSMNQLLSRSICSALVISMIVMTSNSSYNPLFSASIMNQQHNVKSLSLTDHIELIQRSIPLFENKTLVVCAVVREPFVIYNLPENGPNSSVGAHSRRTSEDDSEAQTKIDNYSGVAVEVIRRLAYIFKFKIKIIRPKDNQFGVQLETRRNEWSGLMGVLTRGEADVGLTALSITMSRAQVIDFTRAYYVETVAILLRTPEEVQNYLAIFEPFSLIVWLVLLTTIILLILLVTIMIKLEDDQRHQERLRKVARYLSLSEEAGEQQDYTLQQLGDKLRLVSRLLSEPENNSDEFGTTWLERFYYAVSCVINILFNKDIKNPPHQTPIRILVCVWWLSTIVVVNIYLGILFGQLVIPRRPKSIETLEELVNQNQIDWCVTQGSAIYELFKHSDPSTVYGQLGSRMRIVSSADEGVQRVVESGWAFIRERSILTFKVAREHNRLRACRMQFGKEDFYSVGFGIGLGKGSKYLEPFDSALTLMIENGFVSHWQSMYWPRRNQYTECKIQATEGEPLSIKHFISIYLVCSLIVALAAIILLYQGFHVSSWWSYDGGFIFNYVMKEVTRVMLDHIDERLKPKLTDKILGLNCNRRTSRHTCYDIEHGCEVTNVHIVEGHENQIDAHPSQPDEELVLISL